MKYTNIHGLSHYSLFFTLHVRYLCGGWHTLHTNKNVVLVQRRIFSSIAVSIKISCGSHSIEAFKWVKNLFNKLLLEKDGNRNLI